MLQNNRVAETVVENSYDIPDELFWEVRNTVSGYKNFSITKTKEDAIKIAVKKTGNESQLIIIYNFHDKSGFI